MQTKFVLCVQDGEGWNSFPKRVAKSHVSLTNTIFPSKRAEASFGIRGTQTRLNTSGGQNLLSFFRQLRVPIVNSSRQDLGKLHCATLQFCINKVKFHM